MNQQKKRWKDQNLINHEYIEGSFLFNKIFVQMAFYMFVVKKLGLSNMPLSQQIVINHSFCHETCTKFIIYSYYVCKSCSNDHIYFACIIMFCRHS